MTQTLSDRIGDLRAAMSGPVHGDDDPGYDEARRLWNAAIDSRPAMVAECGSASDVAAAIGFARTHGLEIAVRGGGHSIPGFSSSDGGLVVNLRRMNRVEVDADRRIARVQGGALLADVDAATQAHGLAVPAGLVGHTGIGGLTLGVAWGG